jgi:hypothetical protein
MPLGGGVSAAPRSSAGELRETESGRGGEHRERRLGAENARPVYSRGQSGLLQVPPPQMDLHAPPSPPHSDLSAAFECPAGGGIPEDVDKNPWFVVD